MVSDGLLGSALQGQQQNTQQGGLNGQAASRLRDTDSTEGSSDQLDQDFNRFLELLTTQLENQNPLDPMKTKEMTQQLVQFSQVEQQINQNDKLDELIGLQDNARIKGGLDFVGLKATYKGNQATFDGQNPVDVTYDLNSEADTAKLNILNAAGEVVRSKDVDTGAGRHTAQWKGVDDLGDKVEAGTYNISVEAVGADDEPVESETFVSGIVDGVETQDGRTKLLIGNQSVNIEDITRARQPEPESGDGDTSGSST